MLILQKWESIVSSTFPSVITFWVDIIGIPVHHCTEKTVSTIGKALGRLSGTEVKQPRVRVEINGLQPLEMSMEISLPSGEITVVDFVYEKLEKHCFACFSLSHEKRHCPFTPSSKANSDKPLGVNQLKTLTRLDEDKHRQDSRKRSRSDYELKPRPTPSNKGGRVTANDLREWIRKNSSPLPRASSHRHDSQSRGSMPIPPRDRHKDSSHHDDSYHPKDHLKESSPRARGLGQTNPQSSHRDDRESNHSCAQFGIPQPQPSREGIPSEEHSRSIFSRLQRPHSTPTPSPRSAREPVVTPTPNAPVRNRVDSGERIPLLERIELPSASSPSWTHRHNVNSLALQEVEIQYLGDNPPPISSRLGPSPPADSVFQRLGCTTAGPSSFSPLSLRDQSPLEAGPSSLPKKKKQGKANQGKKTKATPTGLVKPTPKRRTVKAVTRTRGARSPLQGVNLRKANAVRTQSKAKKKLQVDASNSLQGLAEVPIHAAVSTGIPSPSSHRGIGADFRSPLLPLP